MRVICSSPSTVGRKHLWADDLGARRRITLRVLTIRLGAYFWAHLLNSTKRMRRGPTAGCLPKVPDLWCAQGVTKYGCGSAPDSHRTSFGSLQGHPAGTAHTSSERVNLSTQKYDKWRRCGCAVWAGRGAQKSDAAVWCSPRRGMCRMGTLRVIFARC